jgi:hypothetical protein
MKAHQYLEQVKEKLQELADETDKARKSEIFKDYLDTMSKFWDYSYRNQLLIHFSMPTASRIAGFKTWQGLGRKIKKGSKAIRILAPFKKQVIDQETQDLEDVTYFVPVCVFDVTQTDGEELPTLEISLEGDNHQDLLGYLEDFCEVKNIQLDYKKLGINGLYGYSQGGKVVVSSEDTVNTKVNTLVHEIAHELLHQKSDLPKQQKEIQAEGTAYVVCKHFGLETKSFTYLALYKADAEQIMENLSSIASASKEIINFISSFF